jgi:hypothetical protein
VYFGARGFFRAMKALVTVLTDMTIKLGIEVFELIQYCNDLLRSKGSIG